MNDTDQLRAHVQRIHASGVLGRSRLIRQLFDYLVECSLTGKAPKEIEVAVDVFGKEPGFDVSQDAMVRVYIHKLRRKLDQFYAGTGAGEPARIVMPKGAYKFLLEPVEPVATPSVVEPAHRSRRSWLVGALVVSVVLNGLILLAAYSGIGKPHDELQDVRNNPVWSKLLDGRPIVVVIGDYYIFGEADSSMEVTRMVREFSINSHSDLDRYVKVHPQFEDRYVDLDLAYLPTASAFALRDVMPVLAAAGVRTRVVLMSDLSPAMIKSSHLIYIGYLSGLRTMQNLVFAGSRFSVGDTYDELIDRTTQRRYVSELASPFRDETKYREYGYFSTFAGPSGNQLVVIAGTRDVAVMDVAEAVTRPTRLQELTRQAVGLAAFEALYEVYGMDRMNLDGKLLVASKLNTAHIWSDAPSASRAVVQASP